MRKVTGLAIAFMVRDKKAKGFKLSYARRPEDETAKDKLTFLESIQDFHDLFGGTYTFGPDNHHGSTSAFLAVQFPYPFLKEPPGLVIYGSSGWWQ